MKSLPVTRLLPWLLVALCPAVLNHCGGATEHGTETGNPPVVEQQKLHIVLHGSGVEVVGDPGAVSPGASVSVTNRSTGDRAEAAAGADGSVRVSVPGSLQDTYDVTVSYRGGSQTVQVTASPDDVSGDLPTGSDTTGSNTTASEMSDAALARATCDALESTLFQRLSAGFSAGDSTCSTDDDCVHVIWSRVGCFSHCGGSFLSTNGADDTRAQVVADTAPICDDLKDCPRSSPYCAYYPTTPECANGVCRGVEPRSYSCEQLSNASSTRLDRLLEGASRACVLDSDCVVYNPSLTCVSDCGRPTAVARASAELPELKLMLGIRALEDDFCFEFQTRKCPGPLALPCAPPPGEAAALCQAGQCTLSFASPI